jgi:hypothetical protein
LHRSHQRVALTAAKLTPTSATIGDRHRTLEVQVARARRPHRQSGRIDQRDRDPSIQAAGYGRQGCGENDHSYSGKMALNHDPSNEPRVLPSDKHSWSPDDREHGRRPDRPQIHMVLLVLGALAFGAAAGYLIGSGNAGSMTPDAHASTPAVIDNPINDTGRRCAVQQGDQLQLGIEIRNLDASEVTLVNSEAFLPLGGLKTVSHAWGPCAQLSATEASVVLPAHGSIWMTVTFDVQQKCPTSIPVGFAVAYRTATRQGTANLDGFADLGGVEYSRCSEKS